MSEKRPDETNVEEQGSAPKRRPGTKRASAKRLRIWTWAWTWVRKIVELDKIIRALIAIGAAIVALVIGIMVLIDGNPPEGLILFEASQWYVSAREERNEVLQERSTNPKRPDQLYVDIVKVGIGIPDANVERDLTYKKPEKGVLEIDYAARNGKEMGVQFLIVEVADGPPGVVPLDGYKDDYVFLRMRRMPRGESESVKGPPLTFRLDLRQEEGVWFQGEKLHFASRSKWPKRSEGWDIWIPIRPYWDRMKADSGAAKEPTLKQMLVLFGDRYDSPPAGRYWLSTIRLVKAGEKARHTRRFLYEVYGEQSE